MSFALDINGKSPFPSNGDASTSNQSKTPNCEDVERSTSPVLSNTKKSYMRMAKYRSRKKLLGKFTSSQDSVTSSSITDLESLAPLSPVLLDSQVSEDFDNNTKIVEQNVVDSDVKSRFKRVKELQQQKKFHYDAVAKSSVSVNKCAIKDDSVIDNENCDNRMVCVGFKTGNGKEVYISEYRIQKYSDILNELIIDDNDPMFQDLQNNPTLISKTPDLQSTNKKETCSIIFKKQQTQSNNSPVRNNSKKSDVSQTQITDTQMIQAVENAESMLELVDNQWTPDQMSSNKENSQNFNISSINFDTQWDVSPTKTQSENSQSTSSSEENPENLNISYLENVDTQWFFSPEHKKTNASSETSSDIASTITKCETVSVLSSQDFTLHITEEEDNASTSSSPKNRINNEMKYFFGKLSFSTDGSTSLRQCPRAESNMQLRVKSNSWIFDVSKVNEDTLGFNSKYWTFYAKKHRACIEAYERQMFPDKIVEIEHKPNTQKQNLKTKRTKNKNVKKQKPPVAQKKTNLQHCYNLRESNKFKSVVKNKQIVNLKENEEQVIFKVPIGVPIKTTPKSSIKPKEQVDYISLEENLQKICGSPLNESTCKNKNTSPSNNGCTTINEIAELLQKESESNYYIPNTNEETAKKKNSRNKSVLVSIQLKNIQDFRPINQAITKRNNDFLVKVKELEPNVRNGPIKDKLDELKEQMNLKFTQEKDYIKNAEKQNEMQSKSVFAFTTASGKKSEVSEKYLEKIRNNSCNTISEQIEMQSKSVFAFTTASGKKSEVSEKCLEKIRNDSCNTISEIDTNIVCPEDLDTSNFNSPDFISPDFNSQIVEEFDKTFKCTQNESKTASMNEEDFIENVDKILEEIEGKNCSTIENFASSSVLGTCSVDSSKEQTKEVEKEADLKETNPVYEEKLMDLDLCSPIQKEFLEEFNATCDFVTETDDLKTRQPGFATASGGFEKISEKSLEEIRRRNTFVATLGDECPADVLEIVPDDIEEKKAFMKQLNLNYVDKNNKKGPGFATASGGFEKISEKALNIVKRRRSKSNKDSDFVYNFGKKKKQKMTHEESKSKKEQLNLSEGSSEEISQIELKENSRFCFVSEKKPVIKSTNMFNDLENGPAPSISKKEKLLDELKNISEGSVEDVLPLNKLDEIAENKSASKSTNVSNDLENEPKLSLSEKELQMLDEFQKISDEPVEEVLPLIKIDETTALSFVYEKKSSNINDSEPSTNETKKEKQLIGEVKKLSENCDEEVLPPIELNENTGFKFVSENKPTLKPTNIFYDIYGNETRTAESKKEVQYLEEIKNMAKETVEEILPQIEVADNSGFSLVSEKKPTLKPTNILNDIFENESKTVKSKKKEVISMSESSSGEILPLNELNLNTGLSFASEKKLTTKSRNPFNEEPCSSKSKEKQILGLENIAEGSAENLLPSKKLDQPKGFCFASGKEPAIKSTNIFNDIFENETKAAKSKKEEQYLEGLKNMSEGSAENLLPSKELDQPKGFCFASGKEPAIKSTNIFNDIFENENKAAKSKKEEQYLEGLKNMSEGSTEQSSQIEEKDNSSFCFASGKKPAIKTSNIFKDIFENETKGAKSKKEEQFLEGLKNMSEDSTDQLPQIEKANNRGFNFASRKKPTKSTNIFKDIFENETKGAKSKKEEQFLEGLKNMSEDSTDQLPQIEKADNRGSSFVSRKKPTKSTNIFKDIFENETKGVKLKKEEEFPEGLKNMSEGSAEQVPQIEVEDNSGFRFASGEQPAIKTTNIFKDIFENETKGAKSKKEEQFLAGLKNTSEDSIEKQLLEVEIADSFISEKKPAITNEEVLEQKDKPEENNNKNTVIQSYSSPILGMKRPFNSPQIAANSSTPISKRRKLGPSSKKRSLGSAAKSCRQLNLSVNSAKKAKLIFEDFDVQPQDPVNYNNNNNIVIATTSKHVTSTPINEESGANTSLLNTSISMKETNETLINSQKNITPTKMNKSLEKHIPTLYSFQEYETEIKQKSLLEKKYELLKLEMSVFQTRIQMIEEQEELIKRSSPNYRKQRIGCLLCQKSNSTNKLSLKEVDKLQKLSFAKALNAGVDKSLLEITPQNALNFQFFVPWWTNDNRTYPAVIHTEDGAVLIPNDQNSIGVHEIEQGFLAMRGVDPKLVPENWVQNHYKWIVWKFGSYERNFPAKFKGTMTVENVVLQLKYRYDREIDLAQRSALRRILEVDDSPAKRMVLCVSNIFKSQSRQNELELTDGWYSIKTQVDPVLNNLINTNQINIGLKLMIHGAELLNCEGCPPLETPANVRLQIHFNSTRRAAWYCKLGYQRNPGPISVSLHTVRNQGGPVGLTTVYIARAYPVSFMEHGDKIIWRDRKAERRRSNEWEAIQKDIIEKYLEESKNELNAEKNERIKKRKKQNKISMRDVCKLQDAHSIYEIWEECNDPESLTELLTEEQCHILRNYQIQQKADEQTELAARLRRKLDDKNIKNRNVSSVLKMLVVDVGSLYHYRILSVWRPSETHLQELKEGQCVNFYNLTVKDARNLSSTPRTCFSLNFDLDKSKFERFERKIIPINELKNKQMFDEFDAVGFVVEVNNEEDNKYMWIVDENKKFLLIRIRSTFQVVSIFDGITSGKVVAVQNLVHQKPTQSYAIAMANCYTNLFIQPHQPYLQDGMLEFIRNLPENKEEFLEDCKILVNTYKSENNLKLNQLSTSMMYDTINKNNTVGFETDVLTVSDEEMSLIDTQHF